MRRQRRATTLGGQVAGYVEEAGRVRPEDGVFDPQLSAQLHQVLLPEGGSDSSHRRGCRRLLRREVATTYDRDGTHRGGNSEAYKAAVVRYVEETLVGKSVI